MVVLSKNPVTKQLLNPNSFLSFFNKFNLPFDGEMGWAFQTSSFFSLDGSNSDSFTQREAKKGGKTRRKRGREIKALLKTRT